MVGTNSFRELVVWQRSIELTLEIYQLTKLFPREELFGLTSQLRRAAVSIPSNIAEGQCRITKGEFIQFLGIARGSNSELQTQLIICRRLKLGDEQALRCCDSLAVEVGRMLNSLILSLKTPKPSPNQLETRN
jgi:four helix bundle protein